MELETERLRLRHWKDQDLPVFAEINSNELAMEFFPGLYSIQQSNDIASRIIDELKSSGWGLWATELKATGEFIGFVGLSRPRAVLPFSPCVEIGWRLHPKYWGFGYATEGGKKSLEFAFVNIGLDEVVSMTAVSNHPSMAVMNRLGLKNRRQNFIHPHMPVESPVAEYVLYTITKREWMASAGASIS